jgi:sterol desaturase/sphingolipid hydroxylase (fatty acid hydroxylase superfamily)
MDATVVATPFYFGSMEAERRYLRARAEREGPSRADYERRDTITSLTMGVASLLAPMVMPRLLAPFTPGKGNYGKALVAGAVGAVAVTAIADRVARRAEADDGAPAASRTARRRLARAARQVASVGGVASVVTGGIAITTTWASLFNAERLWKRRVLPDLGKGAVGLTAAVFGWDFIYYWNHRFMHESRYMWAIHVVHHSSERYNLSTALRQPVADAFGTFVPYSLLCLLGVRPELIVSARGINLLYQYWIHTDTIRRLGPLEEVLNTPSHHRVHHGTNQEYLDRNHGSILIVWDRLFGTYQRERDPVVYGLTKNINTFDPSRVIAHEHAEMLRDVRGSDTWRERLSFVVRGPGWAYRRHAELAARAAEGVGAPARLTGVAAAQLR